MSYRPSAWTTTSAGSGYGAISPPRELFEARPSVSTVHAVNESSTKATSVWRTYFKCCFSQRTNEPISLT